MGILVLADDATEVMPGMKSRDTYQMDAWHGAISNVSYQTISP